jgi:hypothetical protein
VSSNVDDRRRVFSWTAVWRADNQCVLFDLVRSITDRCATGDRPQQVYIGLGAEVRQQVQTPGRTVYSAIRVEQPPLESVSVPPPPPADYDLIPPHRASPTTIAPTGTRGVAVARAPTNYVDMSELADDAARPTRTPPTMRHDVRALAMCRVCRSRARSQSQNSPSLTRSTGALIAPPKLPRSGSSSNVNSTTVTVSMTS